MIRPARIDDLDAMREIVAQAYAKYVPRMGRRPGPMDDDLAGRIAAGEAWVIEAEGAVQGVLVLEPAGPGVLLLDNVAVAPAGQGRGLGRALVAFAEREARRRGCTELRLYTHVLMTENQALYARLGFREVGRVREKGFDRVYMALRLGA